MNTHSMSIVEAPCDAVRLRDRRRDDLESPAAGVAIEGFAKALGVKVGNQPGQKTHGLLPENIPEVPPAAETRASWRRPSGC
jgi:hypothetical protein